MSDSIVDVCLDANVNPINKINNVIAEIEKSIDTELIAEKNNVVKKHIINVLARIKIIMYHGREFVNMENVKILINGLITLLVKNNIDKNEIIKIILKNNNYELFKILAEDYIESTTIPDCYRLTLPDKHVFLKEFYQNRGIYMSSGYIDLIAYQFDKKMFGIRDITENTRFDIFSMICDINLALLKFLIKNGLDVNMKKNKYLLNCYVDVICAESILKHDNNLIKYRKDKFTVYYKDNTISMTGAKTVLLALHGARDVFTRDSYGQIMIGMFENKIIILNNYDNHIKTILDDYISAPVTEIIGEHFANIYIAR